MTKPATIAYCSACGRRLTLDPNAVGVSLCVCCMRPPSACDCTPRDENGGACKTFHRHGK